MTATKIFSKISNYAETGEPVPVLRSRYTPGGPAPTWSPSETVLPTPTITTPSALSPSGTMILSLWSILQNLVHFLTEQCGELIAELAVHLLFVMAMSYFGDCVDQWLMKVLGHLKPTMADDRIDEEAPHNSSFMWITSATIHELDKLADKIQDRINNLEAAMVHITNGGTQRIKDLCAELVHAKKTITDLKEELRDMTDARNKMHDQAELYLAASRRGIRDWEAEKAKLSSIHDEEMKNCQSKIKEAGEILERLENSLSEAAKKIAHLETQLERKDNDSGKLTSNEHTETGDDKKHILKLEAQCKSLQSLLEQYKADATAKIDKARDTAKANYEKAAARRKEIADLQVNEIKQLKAEITALKEALAKKEDDKPASSFNPAATVSTPSPAISSHSTLPSPPHASVSVAPLSPSPSDTPLPPSSSPRPTTPSQQTPIEKKGDDKPASYLNPAATVFMPPPAISNHSTIPSTPQASIHGTPFFTSPSTTPLHPSPSPYLPPPYQQTPIKKEEMPDRARQNLNKINKELHERKQRQMMGKSAEDAEEKPLTEEELGKYT